MVLPLDHVVINGHYAIEKAADTLLALGFTLTPQGRHSMGSLNHLIVLEDNYLELIGLPQDGGPVRQEILDSPIGIDGLVFRAPDAVQLHQALVARGEPVTPVQSFSRPLTLAGETREAGFRAVRYKPGHFKAGRVYFCQHLTPELIWRPEWQHHANSVWRITGVVIVSAQPHADAQRYAAAANAPATRLDGDLYEVAGKSWRLSLLSPERYAARYGALGCSGQGRDAFFGAIELDASDARALARALAAPGPDVDTQLADDRCLVRLKEFNTLLDIHIHAARNI